MKAPDRIETSRLLLRKAVPQDAELIFSRYASDLEVTRYVSWPRHRSLNDTYTFLQFNDAEWIQWPAGPYLIETKDNGQLIGSTGLSFETLSCASTGYVLAKNMWGFGYATEALHALVTLSPKLGIEKLFALCHPEHRPSGHVLDKCGFNRESLLHNHLEFPNLIPGQLADVLRYIQLF